MFGVGNGGDGSQEYTIVELKSQRRECAGDGSHFTYEYGFHV